MKNPKSSEDPIIFFYCSYWYRTIDETTKSRKMAFWMECIIQLNYKLNYINGIKFLWYTNTKSCSLFCSLLICCSLSVSSCFEITFFKFVWSIGGLCLKLSAVICFDVMLWNYWICGCVWYLGIWVWCTIFSGLFN